MAALLAVGVCVSLLAQLSSRCVRREPLQTGRTYAIKKIVDGDTLVLAGGHTIRLIGVDTPEVYESPKLERNAAVSNLPEKTIRRMGRMATRFVRRYCHGRVARVEFDPANNDKGHLDAYGRFLAHVYLVTPDDPKQKGIYLNRALVRHGFARSMGYAHLRRDEFRRLEAYARRVKAGLWAYGPIP